MQQQLLSPLLTKKYVTKNLDVVHDTVREASIYVTQFCNLRCRHCFASVQNEDRAQVLQVKDLQWIKDNFDPKKVILLGGEPLLYPYLEDALKIFERVTISTNGLLVKDKIDLLKQYKTILQLSLEGRKPYTDHIRGKGVYDKVIEAGTFAKKQGLNCYFRMGYCEQNLKDVKWLLENISAKHKIPLILLPRLDQPYLSVEAQVYLFDLITKSETDSFIDIPHYLQFLGKRGRCNAGSEYLNFNYDRTITPCQFNWDYTLGMMGQSRDIINRNRARYIGACKFIKHECMDCSRADICKGGCRLVNAHLGCPLKADFDINSYVGMHDATDSKPLADKISRITYLLKEMKIC